MLIAMSLLRHSYKQTENCAKEKHPCRNNGVFQAYHVVLGKIKSGKKVVEPSLETEKALISRALFTQWFHRGDCLLLIHNYHLI